MIRIMSQGVMIGLCLGLAGCDSSAPSSGTVAPSGGTVTVPIDRNRVTTSSNPTAERANVRVDNGTVDVQVAPAAGKPAVDVDVREGGNVKVDIDRAKIRERIDERRAERATTP